MPTTPTGREPLSDRPATIPLTTAAAAPLVSVLAAVVARIYPALRAARASPTDALRSA